MGSSSSSTALDSNATPTFTPAPTPQSARRRAVRRKQQAPPPPPHDTPQSARLRTAGSSPNRHHRPGSLRGSSPPGPVRGAFSGLSVRRAPSSGRKVSESAPLVARAPSVLRMASSRLNAQNAMEEELGSLRTHVSMLRDRVEIEETTKECVVTQVFTRWLIGLQEDEHRQRKVMVHDFLDGVDYFRTALSLPKLIRQPEVKRSMYHQPEAPEEGDPVSTSAQRYTAGGQGLVDLERRVLELEMELFSTALRKKESEEALANQCMELSRLRKQLANQSGIITDLLKARGEEKEKEKERDPASRARSSSQASHCSTSREDVKVTYRARSRTPTDRSLPSQDKEREKKERGGVLPRRSTSPSPPAPPLSLLDRVKESMARTDTAPQHPQSSLKGGFEAKGDKKKHPVSISPEIEVYPILKT